MFYLTGWLTAKISATKMLLPQMRCLLVELQLDDDLTASTERQMREKHKSLPQQKHAERSCSAYTLHTLHLTSSSPQSTTISVLMRFLSGSSIVSSTSARLLTAPSARSGSAAVCSCCSIDCECC